MKIAYVVVMFPCYSETFVLNEIRELSRRGVEVAVLSLRNFSEDIIDEAARDFLPCTLYSPYLSIPLLRSHLHFLANRPGEYLRIAGRIFFSSIFSPRELAKNASVFMKSVHFARLIGNETERIHAHFVNYPGTCAYIISRLTGIPFTMTAHAHDIFTTRILLEEKLSRALRVFAVSRYNRDFILGNYPDLPRDRVQVVHCGVNLEEWRFRERSAGDLLRIVSVGRLVATKGFDILLEALNLLRSRGVRVICSIAGDGPERGRLEHLVRRLALEDAVEILGEKTSAEVRSLMDESDLFVLASRRAGRRSGIMDGIPVVLMEAMALGLPVVSCAVSGIPELVRDGETGLLVRPDDPIGLADAVERFALDLSLKKRMAEGGRREVEREYDIRKSVDLLQRCLAGVRGHPRDVQGGRIRVAHIIYGLKSSGAERLIFHFCRLADRAKYDPVVVTLSMEGPLADCIRRLDVPVYCVGKRGRYDISVLARLVSFLRRHRVDIVHTHLFSGDLWGRTAAKIARVPLVVGSLHCVDRVFSPLQRFCERWTARYAYRLIAVSEAVKDFYLSEVGIPPEKIVVIHNGIDFSRYPAAVDRGEKLGGLGVERGALVVGVACRLEDEKDLKTWLRAARLIERECRGVEFLIAGEGSKRRELEEYSHAIGISQSVHFLGPRRDVDEILAVCDVVLSTSLAEGMSLLLLEAMASGRAVVASDLSENREVVEHGKSGILIAPGDAEAYAGAVVALLADASMRRRLGDEARARVRARFTIERCAERISMMYEEGLAGA